MGLRYVGPDLATDPEIVYKDYVSGIKAADLSTEQIDAAIDQGLNAYATRTYVDTQDGLLVPQSYIDAQDNLRVRLSSKDVNNGVAGLDTTGKVSPARINAPLTQRYVRGPWTPAAYNTGSVQSVGADAALYPCLVTDPGFPYKLVVFGQVDAHSLNNETPVVQVRSGSATGEIIPYGLGPADDMQTALLGDDFNRSTSEGLGPDWDSIYFGNGGIGDTGGDGWVSLNGSQMQWNDASNTVRNFRARNVGVNSRYSATNFQKIQALIGNFVGESQAQPNQHLRLFGRVNDAFTAYVGIEITYNQARWFYANANAEQYLTDYFTDPVLVSGQFATLQCGSPSNPPAFSLVQGGWVINTFNDQSAVTAMGPLYRGWGIGVRATTRNFGQSTPPSLDAVYITDDLANYAPVHIVPQALTSQTVKTGQTTLYVRINRLASGAVIASNYKPKLHVMAVPA